MTVNVLVNFEAGTAGDLLTPTYFNTNQIGATADKWTWTVPTTLIHSFLSSDNFDLPDSVTVDGTDYDGTGTRGFLFDLDYGEINGAPDIIRCSPPVSGVNTCIFGCTFEADIDGGDLSMDFMTITGDGPASFQLSVDPFGVSFVRSESTIDEVTLKAGYIPYTAGERYRGYVFYNEPQQRVQIVLLLDSTGEVIGSTDAPADLFATVALGSFTDYLHTWTGGSIKLDNFIIATNANAIFPPEIITVPPPTVVVEQYVDGEVIVRVDSKCTSYKIERELSGVWSTLESDIFQYDIPWAVSAIYDNHRFYTDDTVVSGESYTYRVTGLIGLNESSLAVSDSIAVADEDPDLWHDNIDQGDTAATDFQASSVIISNKFTVPVEGTCTKIRLYASAKTDTPRIKVAIADDAGNILASAERVFQGTVPGYVVIPIDPIDVIEDQELQIIWINSLTPGYQIRYATGNPDPAHSSYKTGQTYAGGIPDPYTPSGTEAKTHAVGLYIESEDGGPEPGEAMEIAGVPIF